MCIAFTQNVQYWILKVNIWKLDLKTINKPQVYRMAIEVKGLLRKFLPFIHIIHNIHVAKQLELPLLTLLICQIS